MMSHRRLNFASRLVDERYRNDDDRRGRVLARLERAAEHVATRRLMQSPLQITILAALVDQIGQAPRDRWRLFHEYYGVIFRREIEKPIIAASILRDYRADVDAIHRHVALLLQTLSEEKGGTDAYLSVHQLSGIVRDRLTERGHEGDDLELACSRLLEAATERLVFLVGLEEGRVGFEVRSLQEFMAAEAMGTAEDRVLHRRLRRLAPLVNWRNVFLFFAGRCLIEREYLSDAIIAVCLEMNDAPDDATLRITGAGSRLAIDLLEEGTVRTSPKLTRLLTREALKLLRLPTEDATEELADSYDESLRASFEDALQDVSEADAPNRSSVWALLLALVRREVAWAIALADQNWPPDKGVLRRMIRQGLYAEQQVSAWWAEKLKLAIPSLAPGDVVPIRRMLPKHARKAVPKWLLDAAEFPYRATSNSLQFLVLGSANRIARSSHKLAIVPTNPKGRWPQDFADMPNPSLEWSQLIAAGQFVKKPNSTSLAEALETIATLSHRQRETVGWTSWPWPLGAALEFASTNEKLRGFSNIAKQGGFGDLPDWLEAEERWSRNGVTEDDFLYCRNTDIPFDSKIARIGLPHGAIRFIDRPNDPETELLDIFNKMPAGRHKGLLARSIPWYLSPLRLDSSRIRTYPNEILREAIRDYSESYFHVEFLSVAENLQSLLADNAKLFEDLVLEKQMYIGPRLTAHSDRSLLGSMQATFCDLFRERPQWTWLLCLIAPTALRGAQPSIRQSLQRIELPMLRAKEKASAVVLRIIEGAWSDGDASVFENRLVRDEFHGLTFVFRDMFDLVPVHDLPIIERLLHRIYDVLDPDEDALRRSIAIALSDLVSRRRSNLLDIGEWDALGLPPSLRKVGLLEG